MVGLVSHYSKYSRVRGFDLFTSVIFSAVILLFVTGFDIFIHDTFVLPSYKCNDPANASLPECQPINGSTTIPILQYEITGRQLYWLWFNFVIGALAILPSLFRGMLGSAKAALMWGLTIILPILGGFEDFLYFELRSIPIPQELPWLEGNVFVGAVNSIYSPQNTVTVTDLYVSMGIAVLILGVTWFLALKYRPQF